MVAPYPVIDSRRAKKLVAELDRLAAIFIPEIRGFSKEKSASRATIEIAGRLAEGVTERLDMTPRRDAIAFYHTLDVPQQPPRSATAPVVFTLSEKRNNPVFAPSRIQIAAKISASEEVLFETRSALNLSPARLTYVAAVDPSLDYIEEPPPQFYQLAPNSQAVSFRTVTFAAQGSETLQIAPEVGLEAGDIIRVDGTIYRIQKIKDGLISLDEANRLVTAVNTGTEVTKVTRFDMFQQRNLQRHVVYLGHDEVFNLEQPSVIQLDVSDSSIAARLAGMGVAVELYGINKTAAHAKPAWQPIVIDGIETSKLRLVKEWQGPVEKVEVHGQKKRWLRIELPSSEDGTQLPDTLISGFKLQVATKEQELPIIAVEINALPDPSLMLENSQETSVSQTIKRAFYNSIPLSLAAPFAPFGSQPLLFDTFTIAAPEALSKKGAKVTLKMDLERKTPPDDEFPEIPLPNPNPELAWEYYNGKGWIALDGVNSSANINVNLLENGEARIQFLVPDDLTTTQIGGQEDYWIRARLIRGDYGHAIYFAKTIRPVVFGSTVFGPTFETAQAIVTNNSNIHAPFINSIEISFESVDVSTEITVVGIGGPDSNAKVSIDNIDSKTAERIFPQTILVENNRAVLDQTAANAVSSAQFKLFQGAVDIDPILKGAEQGRALYLGFTTSYRVNPLSVFVDADEPDDVGDQLKGIELIFEVLEIQQKWRKVSVDDRTDGFLHRGWLNVFIDVTPKQNRLFGRDLFWLRIRPKNNEDRWQPLLNGFYINSVEVEQARTVKQEILGASTGEQNQIFTLSRPPIISNSLELRVREKLSDDEKNELEQSIKFNNIQDQASSNATQAIVTSYPDIPGQWVLWRQVDSFVGKDQNARVYQLDPANGEIRFGDDQQGKIPPAGANAIRAISYQNGGGEQGNVPAFTITDLKSSLESVDTVANPISAVGGVNALDVDTLIRSAPDRLRHRQQALSPRDFEALAVAWSTEIVRARCLTPEEPGGPIKLFIARRTGERCPRASLLERDALADYLRVQGWGAFSEQAVQVLNPDYVPISLTAELLAERPEFAAAIEKEARERILKYLDPIDGGIDGLGWPFGRGLWKSDLFRLLANINGMDRVEQIELEPLALDSLPPSSMICIEEDQININVKSETSEDVL